MNRTAVSLVLGSLAIGAFVLASACTQSPQKLLEAGNRYHDKKKYEEASILYRKAIAKNPRFAEAYYREGLNLLDQSDPIDAVKYLRRAVDLMPDNTDAEVKLGDIYLVAYASDPKKFALLLPDIRDLTTKLLARNKNDFNGLRFRGFTYLADKDLPKAIAEFQAANQVKPYSRDLVGWMAQAMTANNQFDDAEKLIRDMLAHDKTWSPGYNFLFLQYMKRDRAADAEQVLRQRVANDPTSALPYANLAGFLASRNRMPEAETTIRSLLNDPKNFPNGHELVGDFYLRTNQLAKAIDEYQLGAKENPKNDLSYQQRMVTVLAKMGQSDPAKQKEAVDRARALAQQHPQDLLTNQIYASLLLDTGMKQDVTASLKELKRLAQSNNTDPVLHLDLARGYYFEGDKDKALTEALESVRLKPDMVAGRIVAARIYEDRGQHGKVLEQTATILESDPKNPDARLARTQALIGLGETDKAQPELEALVQERPDYHDAVYTLANLYLSEKDYPKAQAEYEKLTQGPAPEMRGFLGLQQLKVEQGQGPQAIAALEDLVQKNPQNLQYRYTLANFQAEVGREPASVPAQRKALLTQAADNYKQILKSNANSADIWLRLGLAQRELGQNDAALASFEQAGRANPASAYAFLDQGMLLESMGQQAKARVAYNQTLGVDPDNIIALNNLAYADAVSGQNLDQAMALAEHAKQRLPHDPNVADTLGFVYLQKNLIDDALREFQSAVAADAKNPMFRLHLAMALLKHGDKAGARREAATALNTAGPGEQAQIKSFISQIS